MVATTIGDAAGGGSPPSEAFGSRGDAAPGALPAGPGLPVFGIERPLFPYGGLFSCTGLFWELSLIGGDEAPGEELAFPGGRF